MKDTEIHILVDEKIEKSMPNCVLHGEALAKIHKQLTRITTYNECNYQRQTKIEKDTEENSERLTVIETRSKTMAGIYIALVALGGIAIWIIDKILGSK